MPIADIAQSSTVICLTPKSEYAAVISTVAGGLASLLVFFQYPPRKDQPPMWPEACRRTEVGRREFPPGVIKLWKQRLGRAN